MTVEEILTKQFLDSPNETNASILINILSNIIKLSKSRETCYSLAQMLFKQSQIIISQNRKSLLH